MLGAMHDLSVDSHSKDQSRDKAPDKSTQSPPQNGWCHSPGNKGMSGLCPSQRTDSPTANQELDQHSSSLLISRINFSCSLCEVPSSLIASNPWEALRVGGGFPVLLGILPITLCFEGDYFLLAKAPLSSVFSFCFCFDIPPSVPTMDPSLPPPSVVQSTVDTFFLQAHDLSSSDLHEASLRRKLDEGTLPTYLLLAVLASAVPFSSDPYYSRTRNEAAEAYAKESWMLVSAEHLTANEHSPIENPRIEVAQALHLLVVLDYAAGRVGSALAKTGLLTRVCRASRLMVEPSSSLPFEEQEEHRRVFWLVYVADKMLSCGKSRPLPSFQDDECTLHLPCDDDTFRAGEWQNMVTLDELMSWDFQEDQSPNANCIGMLMVSILGRCVRYFRCEEYRELVPLWDANSEFSSLTSLLSRAGAYFGIVSVARLSSDIDGVPRSDAGYIIVAHMLYHLCHCLLNHPFLARQRLKPFRSNTACSSFILGLFYTANDHARQLLDLIGDACKSGAITSQSTIFPYWTAIAGSIVSVASHFEASKSRPMKGSGTSQYLDRSLEILEQLGEIWPHAVNTVWLA